MNNYLYSEKWKYWDVTNDDRLCLQCYKKYGKIFSIDQTIEKYRPHLFCRCTLSKLGAIEAGKATIKNSMGADWYLKYYNELPNYYISKQDAKNLGWTSKKGNLNIVAPDKMIFGGVYCNDDNKLPDSPGRIWYEADINYISGWRNNSRVVFSNDGLIFVTYDHYDTFFEII